MLGRGLRCGLSFQSTLPRRERQYNRIEAVTGFPFQSTLPRRERPCAATVPTSTPFNFNPRSREGSDTRYCMLVDNTVISIHAPAKGATMIGGESDSGTGISIHAPAKGATCGPRKWSAMRWYFNPRSREGSDQTDKQTEPTARISIHAPAKGATSMAPDTRRRLVISIHAPAKGATAKTGLLACIKVISIHAPAKGATSLTAIHPTASISFQSTLPRRERLIRPNLSDKPQGFQSTLPRRERHLEKLIAQQMKEISIHAPAKGATPSLKPCRSRVFNFNPRSREGSDTILKQAAVRPPRFQSTLPRRERRRHTSPQRR